MLWLVVLSIAAAETDHPTVGGMLDLLDGQTFTARDRDLLPSGHNLNDEADLWFAGIVNEQSGDGGTTAFDPMRMSSQGRSWTLLRHSLNGVSIDDPGRPGSPVIDLPYSSWQTLTYRSLWTARPGFDATMHAKPGETRDSVWVRGSYGGQNLAGPGARPAPTCARPRSGDRRRTFTDSCARPAMPPAPREFEAQATQSVAIGTVCTCTTTWRHPRPGHALPRRSSQTRPGSASATPRSANTLM